MGRGVTIAAIQAAVAEAWWLRARDMRTTCRARSVARPRQIAMYLARDLTGKSYSHVGYYFGGRDHSTVKWACWQVEQRLGADPVLAHEVGKIRASLTGAA